ncbi:RNA methyltransferase tRNA(m5U54)methyltransferase [Scheffersomyces spartinae]|uniref:tRNA (guanine(26)-N(2))-dimethyltransferase n=1 Tax=Scheffersomyces spartinae TaxID=45513 RepID=A0A9P7VCH5_9ASCO|nr:RNA methyltransferase tRNA(m5U54)methyltransferase [Scheffersomyces spartinae]KAG7195441.1 RNA methyltransferase tRNA(m5U54)methyltransferase [Scheffersomyces spartinae]
MLTAMSKVKLESKQDLPANPSLATNSANTVPLELPPSDSLDLNEYNAIREGKAIVLTPKKDEVFYNPIQQFNRDLSIMGITAWSELYQHKYKEGIKEVKRRKTIAANSSNDESSSNNSYIKILEALSATGLRAIRYAHEIPQISQVVANDLLPAAVESINRNIEYNQVETKAKSNLGDAIQVMNSPENKSKFHVVDLDPYGTASPFLDGAIQLIKDDGLLVVTCTDAGVLAGNGFPEKCFALYGGHNFGNNPMGTDANHEAGLRLILGLVARSAAKYKKSIEPLLSLLIDFYMRCFIRIRTSPLEVKQLASQNMQVFHCVGCGHRIPQPLGRTEKGKHQVPRLDGKLLKSLDNNGNCKYCSSVINIAGPMWEGQLHNHEFIEEVLRIRDEASDKQFGTRERIKGMLSLAKSELNDVPFYINLNQLLSYFKSPPISLDTFSKVVGNLGYRVSLTHAKRNSIKTDCPWEIILKIFQDWMVQSNKEQLSVLKGKASLTEKDELKLAIWKQDVNVHPNLKEGMIGYKVLKWLNDNTEQFQDTKIDYDGVNPVSEGIAKLRKLKMTRYQENPTKNWGPKSRPTNQ